MPACRVDTWPVLSTRAQNRSSGQATAADRDPACPGPGSAGLGRAPGAAARGTGGDQLVPSPLLVWSDPSTIAQNGPAVQEMAGSCGCGHGPGCRRREVDGRGRPGGPVPGHRDPRPGRPAWRPPVGTPADGHAEHVGDARDRGEPAAGRQSGQRRRPSRGPDHRGRHGGRCGRGSGGGRQGSGGRGRADGSGRRPPRGSGARGRAGGGDEQQGGAERAAMGGYGAASSGRKTMPVRGLGWK